MSFRRNSPGQISQALRLWANWREENRDLIEKTGLPEFCFTLGNWEELMEYGSLVIDSIDINDLTVCQKASLLRLIAMRPRDLTSFTGKILMLAMLDAVERIYAE